MDERDIDLLAVFSSPGSMRYGQRGHVLYLSGYEPYFGDAMMLLPRDADWDPLLQVDSADYFPSECTWIEQVAGAADPVDTISEFIEEAGEGLSTLGIVGDYSVPPLLLQRIEDEIEELDVLFVSDLLERQRKVKSEFELEQIMGASAIAKRGFESALDYARPGMTEAEILSEVERVCREEGSEGFPHMTMVTSGTNANHLEWWWYCGKRTLSMGDPWNLDLGTMHNAYCCDIARSFCMGRPKKEHREAYEFLVEAEDAARRAAMTGVMTSEVNEVASEVMERAFNGDFSGIGHGVGLEVHEWPFVGYQYIENDPVYEDSMLEENMVISVEPQVYVKGLGYLQIEDEFVVGPTGGTWLSDLPKELMF